MKNAIKGFWKRFLHFWYPAIIICWGVEDYISGVDNHQWTSMVLGVLGTLLGLIIFYEESEKLREEENDSNGTVD